jgi:hypothetical protein
MIRSEMLSDDDPEPLRAVDALLVAQQLDEALYERPKPVAPIAIQGRRSPFSQEW